MTLICDLLRDAVGSCCVVLFLVYVVAITKLLTVFVYVLFLTDLSYVIIMCVLQLFNVVRFLLVKSFSQVHLLAGGVTFRGLVSILLGCCLF